MRRVVLLAVLGTKSISYTIEFIILVCTPL